MEKVYNIAIPNFADINNYGDIFFPLILAKELKKFDFKTSITFLTPTATAFEGIEAKRYREIFKKEFDAIIFGGGEVVHMHNTMLLNLYQGLQKKVYDLPSYFLFLWPKLFTCYKAWLSVGAPFDGGELTNELRGSVPFLDYVSVRGALTKRKLQQYLGQQHDSHQIEIQPDLGWCIPEHINHYRNSVLSLQILPEKLQEKPYMVFHTLSRCLLNPHQEIEHIVATLQEIRKKLKIEIVLLPITKCWDDHCILKEIQHRSQSSFYLFDNNLSIYETGFILSKATLYVGSSLHGAITAASFGNPTKIIYPGDEYKFTENGFPPEKSFSNLYENVLKLLKEDRMEILHRSIMNQNKLRKMFKRLGSEIKNKFHEQHKKESLCIDQNIYIQQKEFSQAI
jgi:ADP-heptose:LPS heptosyltransferase